MSGVGTDVILTGLAVVSRWHSQGKRILEQREGVVRSVDVRTDVNGLGAILFHRALEVLLP